MRGSTSTVQWMQRTTVSISLSASTEARALLSLRYPACRRIRQNHRLVELARTHGRAPTDRTWCWSPRVPSQPLDCCRRHISLCMC